MSQRTKKPDPVTAPPIEEIALTGYEGYELAELYDEQRRAEASMNRVQNRMSHIAKAALDRARLTEEVIAEWSFHIDAETKRVLLRKGEA